MERIDKLIKTGFTLLATGLITKYQIYILTNEITKTKIRIDTYSSSWISFFIYLLFAIVFLLLIARTKDAKEQLINFTTLALGIVMIFSYHINLNAGYVMFSHTIITFLFSYFLILSFRTLNK